MRKVPRCAEVAGTRLNRNKLHGYEMPRSRRASLSPIDDGSAQALAASLIRQVHHGPRFYIKRGRDQNPVWALPGQCLLSVYLRIPSLPITSR
jgi:hypothetical protein